MVIGLAGHAAWARTIDGAASASPAPRTLRRVVLIDVDAKRPSGTSATGEEIAGTLPVAAQDPISKIPQYKVCGCRVRRADGPPDYAAVLEPQQ